MSKFIVVKWDGIGKPNCVTVNGQEITATHVVMEWGGPNHGYGIHPTLTLTQVLFEPGEEPALREVSGYLVPKDEWDTFERWRIGERRK